MGEEEFFNRQTLLSINISLLKQSVSVIGKGNQLGNYRRYDIGRASSILKIFI